MQMSQAQDAIEVSAEMLAADARLMPTRALTANPSMAECVDEARKAQRAERWREAAGWWFAAAGLAKTAAANTLYLNAYIRCNGRGQGAKR